MTQRVSGQRLGPEDFAFFSAETRESPMNIGSIAVFEGEVPYERFVQNLDARLHLIPRYTQLVVPAPFNIGRPTWEPAPGFDIRQHIHRLTFPAPVSRQGLMDLAADLYMGLLDRRKPLWEMHLVEVEGGRSAFVTKIHHCLVDGVAGVALASVMLDLSPDPPPPPPPPPRAEPGPLPGRATLFLDALFDRFSEAVDRSAGVQNLAVDALMGGDLPLLRPITRALEVAIPYFTVPVKRASFNRGLTPARRLVGAAFPFEEFREIRKHCGGGTVNDVVLAVLAGALSLYLKELGEVVEGRELRVITPVNVRREDERGQLGNRISMILVETPLGVRDPVERLAIIRERTEKLKRNRVGEGIEALADVLLRMPPPLLAAVSALGSPPNWVGNLICTNVPGPMIPLYAVGHRMLEHYALAPLSWEMGLGCAVTSYDRHLFFTLQSDPEAAPDMERLKELLEQSYFELKAAAAEHAARAAQAAVAPAGTPERQAVPAERGAVA